MTKQDFDVGSRLLQLRQSLGLTQRELAKRGNVPHGMISMIERNQSSPSISTLLKILEGIGMSMGDFWSPEQGSHLREQVFFTPSELMNLTSQLGRAPSGAKGSSLVTLLQVGDAKHYGLQLLHECYAPGADCVMDLKHPSKTGGVIISGELEVTVGTQVKLLKAGDSYLFDAQIHHRFRNISDRECRLITASTPAYL